jgi:hypothetical protein
VRKVGISQAFVHATMPSDKTKAKDSLSNVGSLKEQLNSVFKQVVDMFSLNSFLTV